MLRNTTARIAVTTMAAFAIALGGATHAVAKPPEVVIVHDVFDDALADRVCQEFSDQAYAQAVAGKTSDARATVRTANKNGCGMTMGIG